MSEGPQFPFRKKQKDSEAAEAHKREEKRAEALLSIFQQQADQTDDARDREESHKQVERNTWAQQTVIVTAQLRAARRLNLLTGAAACFALVAATGVVWSVLESRDATIEANRAWISIASGQFVKPFPTKIGDALQIVVQYWNSGKEPAQNIRVYQDEFWINVPTNAATTNDLHPEPNNTCSQLGEGSFVGAVWPTTIDHLLSFWGSKKAKVADVDFAKFNKFLAVHGCLEYTTFLRAHRTAYCLYLNPSSGVPIERWSWSYCPGHDQNFAD